MTDEKWGDVRTMIEEKFQIIEEGEYDEDTAHIVFIEFQGPLGHMKIERISHPKKLGVKTQYSNRIGSDVSVTNVYSEDEFIHNIKAYRLSDDDEWQEIDAGNML